MLAVEISRAALYLPRDDNCCEREGAGRAILATDSMTQVSQGQQFITSWSNARKLFQVNKLPVGIMTFGLGNIGDISVEGLVREFCLGLPANVRSVDTIGARLFAFIKKSYDRQFRGVAAADKPVMGFFVAGYDSKPFAEQQEFQLPVDTAPRQVSPNRWSGPTGGAYISRSAVSTKASILD